MTAGGPIQYFKIPNITNVNDDPIFSVSGDIALNWRYHSNGVRIDLTGGHLSDNNSDDDNTHGLGVHLWLMRYERAEEADPKQKIEITNIQDCPPPACAADKQKVQGTNHGPIYNSGPVYGNYAIYVSNSTANFPTDQNLGLVMKSKNINFTVLYCLFYDF